VANSAFKIVLMKRADIRACNEITAVSEPWKTLNERIDFAPYIGLKQAYVCTDGEGPAGFVIFTPEPVFARGGYLRAIGVAPAIRGRGFGRELMLFAEQTTSRLSPNFYLCVSSFNRQAQAFYENLGYVKTGELPDLIVPGVSEYIYWKRLWPLPQPAGSS
jgi:ribosomal protein S18 acetylase RimI-like enzyme